MGLSCWPLDKFTLILVMSTKEVTQWPYAKNKIPKGFHPLYQCCPKDSILSGTITWEHLSKRCRVGWEEKPMLRSASKVSSSLGYHSHHCNLYNTWLVNDLGNSGQKVHTQWRTMHPWNAFLKYAVCSYANLCCCPYCPILCNTQSLYTVYLA